MSLTTGGGKCSKAPCSFLLWKRTFAVSLRQVLVLAGADEWYQAFSETGKGAIQPFSIAKITKNNKAAAETCVTWSAQPGGLATCHLCQQCPRCGACNLEWVEEAACRSSLQSLRKGQGCLLSLESLGMLFASVGRDMWLALLALIRIGNPWEVLSYKCHAETDTLVPTKKLWTIKSTLSPELSLTALGELSLPTRDFSLM